MDAPRLPLLVGLIAVALAFDFLNGLHDAANSIATIVSTRVLRPQYAVALGGVLQFHRLPVFRPACRRRRSARGIVDADDRRCAGDLRRADGRDRLEHHHLVGSAFPRRVSHALIGGLVGAGIAKAGSARSCGPGSSRPSAAIVLSPMIGFLLALAAGADGVVAVRARRRRSRVDALSACCNSSRPRSIRSAMAATTRRRPWASSPCCFTRRACSASEFYVPFWVVITCQAAMGLGTLFGGWRIVHTMGSKITRLTPMQGFCAETGGAITLFAATWLGIPVSTTHTITGAIIGVGAAKKVSRGALERRREIVIAWIITMPAAGLIAALFYWLSGLIG